MLAGQGVSAKAPKHAREGACAPQKLRRPRGHASAGDTPKVLTHSRPALSALRLAPSRSLASLRLRSRGGSRHYTASQNSCIVNGLRWIGFCYLSFKSLRLRGGHAFPAFTAARFASRMATICRACDLVSSRRLARPPQIRARTAQRAVATTACSLDSGKGSCRLQTRFVHFRTSGEAKLRK
jgi:hypothetical protein